MNNENIARFMEQTENTIDEYGHSIIFTGAEVEGLDQTVSMAYTVGLSDTGFPEMVVFGLPENSAGYLINDAAALLRQNKLPLNVKISDIANFPLVFKEVISSEGYMNVTNRRAGKVVPAIQMIWPNRAGKFPWEDGADEYFKKIQIPLYENN